MHYPAIDLEDLCRLSHNTLEAILVPLDRLGLVNAVRGADAGLGASALGDALAWAGPSIMSANHVQHTSQPFVVSLTTYMQQ